MRGPKPQELTLSEKEQKELEVLVRRHNAPQQQALRGRIILAAAEGKNNTQIARELHVSVDTVRTWRTRWIALQAIDLADLDVESGSVMLCAPVAPRRSPANRFAKWWLWRVSSPKSARSATGRDAKSLTK